MPEIDIRPKVEEFVKKLASTSHVEIMYGSDHRITTEAIDALYVLLSEILELTDELTIGIIGDEIAFETKPFYDTSVQIKGFIDHLKGIDLKKMSFKRGVGKEELDEFNHLLTTKVAALAEGGIEALYAETSIQNISIGEIGYRKESEEGEGEVIEKVQGTYEEGMEYLAESFDNVKGHEHLNVGSARQIVNRLLSDITKHRNLLLILSATKSHSAKELIRGMNVAVFTLLQAEALGLEKQHLNAIGVAALLHNSGEMTSAETEEEEEEDPLVMTEEKKRKTAEKQIKAAKILLDTPGIDKMAAIAAFEEEVNYDGSGVPDRLYGEEPLIISMMIAISNYYDRLRAHSEFKKTGGVERIYEEMMKLSGTKFHPDLLRNFFSLVGVYPPGTLVELNTGEMGLVVQQSTLDLKRPQIEVLYGTEGEKYEEPKIINLLEKDKKGKYRWSIEKSIAPEDKFEIPEKYK